MRNNPHSSMASNKIIHSDRSNSGENTSVASTSNDNNGTGDRRETVAEIAARLREGEDFRMATRMQEEEFKQHFSKNRDQRAIVGRDTKLSRREQQMEERREAEERRRRAEEIARRDEEMARELCRQMEEEERKRAEEQAKKDEELARKLQEEDAQGGGRRGGEQEEDVQLAERMKRQFIQQFREETGGGGMDHDVGSGIGRMRMEEEEKNRGGRSGAK